MAAGIRKWWDSICSGCGQCCCSKIRIAALPENQEQRIPGSLTVQKNYAVDYSSPCCYLDIETGVCLVYEKRFAICRSCIPMTIFHAFFAGYLPADCAYVKKFRFWRRFYNV